jgi:hypothetical protein
LKLRTLLVGLTTIWAIAPACLAESGGRDPWLWPFAVDSIWNCPIGSDADYQSEGHFPTGTEVNADTEFHYKTFSDGPKRKLFQNQSWPVVDGEKSRYLRDIAIDDDVILRYHRTNNCTAILSPDGDTIEQLGPFIRFHRGQDVIGIPAPFWGQSIRGLGTSGGHWGSQLSSFGGTLRHGHLTGELSVTFALKLNCQGTKYLHYDRDSKTPGYRWPALNCDAYASKPSKQGGYQGKDRRIVMGSLLAIHPQHTIESLGLRTSAAKRMFRALQDYGVYLVDDAGFDRFAFSVSHEAEGEFGERFGYPFNVTPSDTGPAAEWYSDLMAMITRLSVVDNNSAEAKGGGGTPRAPLAPPFAEMNHSKPSVPEKLQLVSTTDQSVTLRWSPVEHDIGICNYWVFAEDPAVSERVAETFGKTEVTVNGLSPGTDYQLTVQARSRTLALSMPSLPVAARTQPIAPGTLLENFDDGQAQGWAFTGEVVVRGKRLEIGSWTGDAMAICEQPLLPEGAFRFSGRTQVFGGAHANLTRIYFRSDAAGKNAGMIEFGGGKASVRLIQKNQGQSQTIATAEDWDGGRFELTVDDRSTVTLNVYREDQAQTSFERVPLALPSGGRIGFATSFNRINVDDVRIVPLSSSLE